MPEDTTGQAPSIAKATRGKATVSKAPPAGNQVIQHSKGVHGNGADMLRSQRC